MLYFTEVHSSLPDIYEVNTEFESSYDRDEYEAKVAGGVIGAATGHTGMGAGVGAAAGAAAGLATIFGSRGKDVTLKEFRGKDVILYFYPKDDTPGCTKEACSFRDHESDISKAHAVVLGVSTDAIESHDKFRGKYELNFPLLSDPGHRVARYRGAGAGARRRSGQPLRSA